MVNSLVRDECYPVRTPRSWPTWFTQAFTHCHGVLQAQDDFSASRLVLNFCFKIESNGKLYWEKTLNVLNEG